MAFSSVATERVAGANDAADHDVRKQYHIFERVLEALNQEAARVSSAAGTYSRYNSVHVLLIKWEHDDLGVTLEVDALATVFKNDFGFQVEQFTIPIEKSLRLLSLTVLEWAESYDHHDGLLILYYAGHGRISNSGRTVVWHNRFHEDNMYSELRWTGCEEILLEATSDKLFIFDCCYAASTISTGFRGVSETICASGFESIAPRPGPHSFTTALIFVLRQMARYPRPFSVSILYAAVLIYLKELDPTQIAPDGFRIADARDHTISMPGLRRPEYRRTPIHFVRTHHHQQSPDIQLFPLTQNKDFVVIREEERLEKSREIFPTVTLRVRPAGNLTEVDIDAARRWLRNIPLPTETISVEAAIAINANSSENPTREFRPNTGFPNDLDRMRSLNEEIMSIAKKTQRETTSIHIITFTTLIFIPATFVASLFSSDILVQEPHLGRTGSNWHLSSEIWLFLESAGVLTIVTVSVWLVSYVIFRRYSRARKLRSKDSIYKVA